MIYEFLVGEEYDGKKLAAFLRAGCSLSCSLVRSLKHIDGGILLDGGNAHTDAVLSAGQKVTVSLPEPENELSQCDTEVPILYEDGDALVYDKPAGMATHPTLNAPNGTLANVYAALLASRGERGAFRPINRLDRNTSGALLAAKTRYAAPLLAKSAAKVYIAVCEGDIPDDEGTIDAPIGRADGSIISRCVRADGERSVTHYEVLERFGTHTLLRLRLETGRTHQIRVHMSHVGHPLAGDDLYGGSRGLIARHALHCASMSFTTPEGKTVSVQSPLCADMLELIAALREKSGHI